MKQDNIEDVYELSPMQQGMLFHTLAAPRSGVYFEQHCYTLQTNLNISVFKKAWQRIIERHPILRTSFYWENLDKPYQVVYRQVELPWEFRDWRELPSREQQAQLEIFLENDREYGFVLSHAPLIRLTLIRIAEDTYHFVFSFHHILMEGWSITWLWKEFYGFYYAFCKGQDFDLERPRQYKEYILWIQQQNISKAETFWRQKLNGFTSPTSLGVNKASGNIFSQNDNCDTQNCQLSHSFTESLKSFASRHQLTLNVLFKGAWALLLSRYSGEEDIVFGATSSGRPAELAEAESMVGLFINTLPLRVQVSSNAVLLPWLKQLQAKEAEMRQYEYAPLMQIHQWSEVPPGLPLFESLVVFNNFFIHSTQSELAESFGLSRYQSFEKTNYPITLLVLPGEQLSFKIMCGDSDRFKSDIITRMLGHLQTLFESMVTNQQQSLGELSLLTESERHQLLVEWNDTKVDYPLLCIHELFEAQVEKTPDAVAVVFEDQQLTYKELNKRANQLAHHLRSHGVKSEVLVGICVERSLDMVIGLLAILKAGGAYVPLDPNDPKERLAYMLEDSQPSILLTQQCLLESLPSYQAKVICIDSNWEKIASESTENPASNTTIDNLAYVIYTSGSTGKPKGAMNSHSGICNRLLWMQDTYQLTSVDAVLQKTPFSFDVSVWEFFWTLITGARLVVAQPEGHRDPNYLVNLIRKQRVTTLHFVPSMMQVFLEAEGLEKCQSLVQVIASGEALPVELQQRFFNRLNAQLHNLYGPTEAAVDVTYWQCKKDNKYNQNTVPIGQPIANIQIYIVDKYLNSVPIGVTGEVYIGGVGVARGYLNRPDLSAEKFIPNPFSTEATRLYKTGDLARYLPSGDIEYIGRIDNQVKIRGFRIELGEIEAQITQYPAIRESVVAVREDTPGDKRLVAYIVSEQELTPKASELRSFLKEKLPNYMIPAVFIEMKTVPLTPNGKVNRKALPAPDGSHLELETAYIKPRNDIEKSIATVWQKVLKIEKVGIHDNFFELGGHSLLLLQVHSQLHELFQTNLLVLDLFRYPTISTLSEFINQVNNNKSSYSHQTEERTQQFKDGKARIKQLNKISKGIK